MFKPRLPSTHHEAVFWVVVLVLAVVIALALMQRVAGTG